MSAHEKKAPSFETILKDEINKKVLLVFVSSLFFLLNFLAIYSAFRHSLSGMPPIGIALGSLISISIYAIINGKETLGENARKSFKRLDVVLKLVFLVSLVTLNGIAAGNYLSTSTLGWINISGLIGAVGLQKLTCYFQNKDPDYIEKRIEMASEWMRALEIERSNLQVSKSRLY